MKKIPTLYKREFSGHKITGIRDEITPGCEAALTDESIATLKLDGACCAIINGEFYKRFDAKPDRAVPEGAIPCDEPDPVTGHWPHWVKVAADNPADKWFVEARNNSWDDLLRESGAGWSWPPWRASCSGMKERRCAKSSAKTLALSGR